MKKMLPVRNARCSISLGWLALRAAEIGLMLMNGIRLGKIRRKALLVGEPLDENTGEPFAALEGAGAIALMDV
ncbi:hypothetical protein GCM10007418_11640 [Halopseudomonas salina]|uniref:Uncharacterized protein n=1 Tax=Halopseudomonas salina TaxID=1323744 RepID=A0ABQ1PBL2_9GAMM|nr:hypothetical protein GCM10007418_11640 [Halopseudomonas salina]